MEWVFVGASPEGQAILIDGLDVWRHEWSRLPERAVVRDPRYNAEFNFQTFAICAGGRRTEFAAGEFSNGMWGFYQRRRDPNG